MASTLSELPGIAFLAGERSRDSEELAGFWQQAVELHHSAQTQPMVDVTRRRTVSLLEDGMPLRAANLARAILRRVAETAVGPSTARGQGPSGIVQTLRESLDDVDLFDFRVRSQQRFASVLDRWTDSIRRDLPTRARSWGLARKCLNIFLRDCYYNAYLRPILGAQISEDWFELSLDRLTATSLRAFDCELPRWRGVRHLTPETSSRYQESAAALAKQWEVGRVHLDTFLWIEGRRRERIALRRMGRTR